MSPEPEMLAEMRRLSREAREGAVWRRSPDNPNTGRFLIEDRAVATALEKVADNLDAFVEKFGRGVRGE